MLKLSDMKQSEISLFLFGEAFKAHWTLEPVRGANFERNALDDQPVTVAQGVLVCVGNGKLLESRNVTTMLRECVV